MRETRRFLLHLNQRAINGNFEVYLNAFKEMAIMTGRVTARIGSGKGGTVREKEGRRQVFALSFSIPDFCFPDPEMGFEPIKSRVSRGLSPMEAWDGKRIIVSDMRCAPLRY